MCPSIPAGRPGFDGEGHAARGPPPLSHAQPRARGKGGGYHPAVLGSLAAVFPNLPALRGVGLSIAMGHPRQRGRLLEVCAPSGICYDLAALQAKSIRPVVGPTAAPWILVLCYE